MSIEASRLMALRSAILEQNSALQRAAGIGGAGGATEAAGRRSAVSRVNEMQSQSAAITEAYERGETTDIAAVMLARQQASIGFEATLQVRNRLLTAYKDIMSMPV